MTYSAGDIYDVLVALHREAHLGIRSRYVSANDVWSRIGVNAELQSPTGTMGRAFAMAHRRGVIAQFGEPVESVHPQRKRGMIRQWKFRL